MNKIVLIAILLFTSGGFIMALIRDRNFKVDNIPMDFEAGYSWGACHAEWGRNDLKVNKEGGAELELTEGFFMENKKYSFTPQEVAEIYGLFIRNNFFALNSEYRSNVVDGNCSSLTLKASGKSHKVSMNNQSPNQVTKITEKILATLNSKDSNWSQINKKPQCDEAKIACVTGKEYEGTSCDFLNRSCEGI